MKSGSSGFLPIPRLAKVQSYLRAFLVSRFPSRQSPRPDDQGWIVGSDDLKRLMDEPAFLAAACPQAIARPGQASRMGNLSRTQPSNSMRSSRLNRNSHFHGTTQVCRSRWWCLTHCQTSCSTFRCRIPRWRRRSKTSNTVATCCRRPSRSGAKSQG